MENVEELKSKLQCGKCHNSYSADSQPVLYMECKHHMCKDCSGGDDDDEKYDCPVCECSTKVTKIPFLHDFSKFIISIEKSNEELKNENDDLKEKQRLWEVSREDHHKCAECETTNSEQIMQLCGTCHELKFKDLEDVKNHALCPSCAIKKHIRQDHQTVDFFPYLSAFNFSSHSSNIKSKSDQFKNVQDLIESSFFRFKVLSINASEWYDVMTDMARRSKTTKHQLQFVEKMETFMEESKSIHAGTDSELKERTKLLQESLNKIKEWCKITMENCVDDIETIKLDLSADSNNNVDPELSFAKNEYFQESADC